MIEVIEILFLVVLPLVLLGAALWYRAKSRKAAKRETLKDVFETLTEKQKNNVYWILGNAIEEAEQDRPITRNYQIWAVLNAKQRKMLQYMLEEAVREVRHDKEVTYINDY